MFHPRVESANAYIWMLISTLFFLDKNYGQVYCLSLSPIAWVRRSPTCQSDKASCYHQRQVSPFVMESMSPSRPSTFRVENIPPGTTAEQLKFCFHTEDQPGIRIRSIVPAADNYELDVRELTATVTFQALNRSVLSPRLLDDDISIDCDFYGFTPLNHPSEPIAAE